MILRRVIKHVRNQEWTAIGIDFLIVVIGVFVGLQVSNWNDTRGDRQRETQILQEIAADLRADIVGYSDSLDSTLHRVAAIAYILENTPKSALSTPWGNLSMGPGLSFTDFVETSAHFREQSLDERAIDLKDQLWGATVFVANAQSSSTAFESLVNSGELGILQNEAVVRQLQEYRMLVSALEKAQDVTFRPGRDNAIQIGEKYGLAAFSYVDDEALFALVAAEPQLSATIQTQLGWAQGHFLMLSRSNDSAEALLTQIENELGIPADDDTSDVE